MIDPHCFKKNSKRKPITDSGCADVYFVTEIKTGKKCVLKQTKKILTNDPTFYREIEILSSCKHPAIVNFIGYNDEGKKGNIYLEEVENGSLERNIIKHKEGGNIKNWDDTHKLIIAYGVARAMEFLHKRNIIHRDLKPDNVLLDGNLYPYVTDFGTSRSLNESISLSHTIQQTTPTIMAPEFINDYINYNRTKPIDVFSYAMVIYYLITEIQPFAGMGLMDILKLTTEGYRPELSKDNCPNENWEKLISKCWSQNPNERPTFSDICTFLESPDFLTSNIDIETFNTYKELIKSAQSTEKDLNQKSETEKEKSYLEKLKEAADEGDAIAQNIYALRLYNGLGIEQDQKSARHYFELAAQNGNYESKLFLSQILDREGQNPELAADLLRQSIDSNEVPEAQSIYGQNLVKTGNLTDGTRILLSAIQRGSISAMIAYGNICSSDGQYGNPDIFYTMASNCCHCLDEIGFYFPIDYKVYKCEICNVEICEGCAKNCHKDHKCVEIGMKHSFVCDCGKKGFKDNKKKKNLCSFEFIGQMKCNGQPMCYQHLYQCRDCNSNSEGKYICRGCAETCHKGHNVIDRGIQKGFCSCGSKQLDVVKMCKLIQFNAISDTCSFNKKKTTLNQRCFQCATCGMCNSEENGICQLCASKCHCDHIVFDRGVKKMICHCRDTGKCQLKK